MVSGHQRITWRRNIADNFNRLSRAHERYRRQTDDRQTDGQTTTNSEHEHEFTFAKNWSFLCRTVKAHSYISATTPLIFTGGGGQKCEIWRRFSTPLATCRPIGQLSKWSNLKHVTGVQIICQNTGSKISPIPLLIFSEGKKVQI